MIFRGTVTKWDDAKGFGFIAADGGKEEVFFHHSDLQQRNDRPAIGRRVEFAMTTGPKGKRARQIASYRASVPHRPSTRDRGGTEGQTATGTLGRRRQDQPQTLGPTPLWPLVMFALLWLALPVFASPPRWSALVYLAMTILTFMAYALDKSAARRGSWRTKESTLHLLSLLGGWPGALLAQRHLRHKNRKADFRATFWATMVLNVAALLILSTDWARSLLA